MSVAGPYGVHVSLDLEGPNTTSLVATKSSSSSSSGSVGAESTCHEVTRPPKYVAPRTLYFEVSRPPDTSK